MRRLLWIAGALVAWLVLVVLVAKLIYRRRERRRGLEHAFELYERWLQKRGL